MSEFLQIASERMRSQHGLITTAQACELGASREHLSDLVRRSIWERLERGVYGSSGTPMTWQRQCMVAILTAPPGTLLSHRAAAHALGIGGFRPPPLPEVTIRRGSTMRRSGVVVHESKDLDLAERVCVDGIPCTGPRRLAMDLGDVVSPGRYVHAMREIRHGHRIRTEQLLHVYLRHKQRGRNGGGALRDWLDRYFKLGGAPESGLEQVVVDALLDAGVPAFVTQYEVSVAGRRFRLDIAFVDLHIVVEVDGAQHEDPDIAPYDATRTALLEAEGWTVLRVRSRHLATDLAAVIRHIRSVVDSSGHS